MSNNMTILFASLMIWWGLVFAGMNMQNKELPADLISQKVKEWIDNYKKEEAQKVEQNKQLATQANAEKINNLPPVSPSEHIRWKKDAPFTLIEYSDFECPFCKRFHNTTKELLAKYPNQINLVFRNNPLPFHDPNSTQESLAIECAWKLWGSDKFFALSDLIFDTTKSNKWLEVSALPGLAEKIWLSKADFNTCLSSQEIAAKVKSDMAWWGAAWVTWTPGSFLINNQNWKKKFIKWAKPLSVIEQAMEELK